MNLQSYWELCGVADIVSTNVSLEIDFRVRNTSATIKMKKSHIEAILMSAMAASSSGSGRGTGKPTSFAPELQSMLVFPSTAMDLETRLLQENFPTFKKGLERSIGTAETACKKILDLQCCDYRFSLGDARRPLHETAVLVEEIVHTQLINMLQQASEVSQLRGSRVISAEDLLFLMRKDKKKLKRMLKYMVFRDYKSKVVKTIDEDEMIDDKASISGSSNKRQKVAHDFLNSLDQTGELLSLFEDEEVDEVKQERMERAERQTRSMDAAQYAEFCESRQLSFSKKASKFRDWLDCSHMEIKPNAVAMEILAYMAYETVAQLVDLALLVKQDMNPKASDPFSHAISATYVNYHNPTQSAAACGAEPQTEAIRPCHIREAIRRYGHRIGPLSPFTSAYHRPGMSFLAC